eukprot:CAMPEP_0178746146 /NCGR_PEP_ID=MMETSP0744-20121128/7659_1 /TAXON_ID=913974 /ORGANISM="Nitzschia punctata, Strain CCMP561" /LENGTH=206 /DNA_ID=CAMNT_0020399349 /DNA_START=12 /DNA_END=632 /DNA_ORIENTATION=+
MTGLLWLLLATDSVSFQVQTRPWHGGGQREGTSLSVTRRDFLVSAVAAEVSLASFSPHLVAQAADSTSSDANVFGQNNLSVEDARKRFQAARNDLRYLLENYADISKGGGDAVRNYLGTQGVKSNLFGIQKVLKILREESEDIVEYTEAMDEFNAYYYQAEGAAYQSMFAEHSSAKSTPESLLATAKQDIAKMEKYMDILASQLGN